MYRHSDGGVCKGSDDEADAKGLYTDDTTLTFSMPKSVARFASGAALGEDGAFFPWGNASSLDCMWSTDVGGARV